MKVHIEAAARRDVREISRAYEEEQRLLGDEFVDEFKKLLLRIREMPLSFPKITEHARRALLERFPYSVFFEMLDNRNIVIVAVLHQRRGPRAIMRRVGR